MRRAVWVLLVLGLLVLSPLVVGLPNLAGSVAPTAGNFNGLEMALADFRGDGILQVVAQNDDGFVYVMDPRTGTVLARLAPGNAGCTQVCYDFEGISGPISAPQVADLDNNGRLDVVVASTAAVVARFEFSFAASTPNRFVFNKLWEHRYNPFQPFTTMDASPVIADLDGDGTKDILIVVEQDGIFAVRADGTPMWQRNVPGGHASPSVADLDGDGRPEVVIARDDGIVEARDGATGGTRWTFDARSYVQPASIPMAPTLADITGDGRPDVLFMARDAHDANAATANHAVLFALDSFGTLLWRFQPAWMAPLSHTRPVVVSVEGKPHVLGGDWNTMGHHPGQFERVGPGHVFLVDAKGRERWHRDLNAGTGDAASFKDLAVADVRGDGKQQVIVPGTRSGKPGLLLFDLAGGSYRGILEMPHPTRSGAVVGDLFGDGRFAMAVAVAGGQIQIWRSTKPLLASFPGWGALTIPKGIRTGAPEPPIVPPDAYSAAFTPRGNGWWVETGLNANQQTLAVDATVNGGAPIGLALTRWGTWAKSIPVAGGSLVQFTARSAGGATSTSPCHAWLSFTVVSCDGTAPPPPPSGTLAATFTPRGGSEWWVQVRVVANQALAGVDARVDSGTWQPLASQWWGDWATSMHAPPGSAVQFRARATSAEEAFSPTYTWPMR